MNPKHILGPWFVDSHEMSRATWVIDIKNERVCKMEYRDDAAANAALIASAPRLFDENSKLRAINAELVAALEAIKGIAAEGVLSRSCTGQPTWTAFGAIKEIIAKAKGE